jgi:hypothetical protein
MYVGDDPQRYALGYSLTARVLRSPRATREPEQSDNAERDSMATGHPAHRTGRWQFGSVETSHSCVPDIARKPQNKSLIMELTCLECNIPGIPERVSIEILSAVGAYPIAYHRI